MIEAGKTELNYPEEVLNEFGAGLFNMNFAIGEVLGPLLGNKLYVEHGMKSTSNYVGSFILFFTFLYFLMCDKSMPWQKEKKKVNSANDTFNRPSSSICIL